MLYCLLELFQLARVARNDLVQLSSVILMIIKLFCLWSRFKSPDVLMDDLLSSFTAVVEHNELRDEVTG